MRGDMEADRPTSQSGCIPGCQGWNGPISPKGLHDVALPRYPHAGHCPGRVPLPLPIVDWSQVGQSAPVPIPISNHSPTDPLPKADIVILTWTENEWTAFDHVFLRSTTTHLESYQVLTSKWSLYSRQAPSSSASNRLWGYFQLVRIKGAGQANFTVLLFKCDAHLAHPPWLSGLAEMVSAIIADAKPSRIYSIGTAGGAKWDPTAGRCSRSPTRQRSNSPSARTRASITLQQPDVLCTGWFPNALDPDPESSGRSSSWATLSGIATQQELQRAVLQQTQKKFRWQGAAAPFTLADLLNPALDPANLGSPKAVLVSRRPLAHDRRTYQSPRRIHRTRRSSEMDDAVIARVAGQKNVHYAFVRNISDPLIPSETSGGRGRSPPRPGKTGRRRSTTTSGSIRASTAPSRRGRPSPDQIHNPRIADSCQHVWI